MNLTELRRFAPGGKASILSEIVDAWHYADEADITTPHRICHFIAQLAHESAGLATTVERGGPEYFARYDGRDNLGNTKPGDGARYKGRGLIQCTGRANYAEFNHWAQQRYPDAPDFIAKPDEVAEFPWAFVSAVWFWEKKGLNRYADRNDIRSITKRINGGLNGLPDRRAKFRKAVAIWGDGEVNEAGSSFLGTRAVKAGAAGGAVTLASLSDGAMQASSVADAAGSISDVIGMPVWQLVLIVGLLLTVGYLLWDRFFIYRNEGL